MREASPAEVGLDPAPIDRAVEQVRGHEQAPESGHPMYAGAVALMGHDGAVVARDASGHALRYATPTTELPREQWVPMREDTVFDLASVSKLFTSIAAVQLIEDGRLELEAPVAAHLPEFAANGKEPVTVRHLLTHTSGFTSWLPLYSRYPDLASRLRAVIDAPLENPPGTTYLYSDLNLITLCVLVERLTGQGLDEVVRAPFPATTTGSGSSSTNAGTWTPWPARASPVTPGTPARRSSSTSPRTPSRSCSPTGCTPTARGGATTRRDASGRRGWPCPWGCDPGRATRHGVLLDGEQTTTAFSAEGWALLGREAVA